MHISNAVCAAAALAAGFAWIRYSDAEISRLKREISAAQRSAQEEKEKREHEEEKREAERVGRIRAEVHKLIPDPCCAG
jgi:hypothetical protein